jgi:hypothetical protein
VFLRVAGWAAGDTEARQLLDDLGPVRPACNRLANVRMHFAKTASRTGSACWCVSWNRRGGARISLPAVVSRGAEVERQEISANDVIAGTGRNIVNSNSSQNVNVTFDFNRKGGDSPCPAAAHCLRHRREGGPLIVSSASPGRGVASPGRGPPGKNLRRPLLVALAIYDG